MEVTRLKAERRAVKGRNQVQQIRRQGWLPVIMYGGTEEPVMLSVSEWEMEQHIRHHHRVYQIEVDGRSQDAYLQEVQYDNLTDRLMHIDFKRIDLTKPIETEVEVEYVGHPVGLGKGGVLIKDYTSLPVKCLPTQIPDKIEVNVGPLDLHQSILAKDVVLPQGVTLLIEADDTVCHISEFVAHAPAAPVAETVEPETVDGKPEDAGEAADAKKDEKEKKED